MLTMRTVIIATLFRASLAEPGACLASHLLEDETCLLQKSTHLNAQNVYRAPQKDGKIQVDKHDKQDGAAGQLDEQTDADESVSLFTKTNVSLSANCANHFTPKPQTYRHQRNAHEGQAHFAQLYHDWPFKEKYVGRTAFAWGNMLVVTSRTDGVIFYKIGGQGQEYYQGKWSPQSGQLFGSWDKDWEESRKKTRNSENYHIASSSDAPNLAVEGQTRFDNMFVVVAICRGSKDIKSLFGTLGCLQVRAPGSETWEYRPVLFVFDLAKPIGETPDHEGSFTVPNYATPLFHWNAALHVSLFVAHSRTNRNSPREQLRAMVSSGFSQGLISGSAGQMQAVLVATRLCYDDGDQMKCPAMATTQPTSSFGVNSGGPWEHPWQIDTGVMSLSTNPEVQKLATVGLPGVWYPEGVTVWQPTDAPYKTFVITAGVMGGVGVADFSGVSDFEEPTPVTIPSENAARWSQLVGRTFLGSDQRLYGAFADWANNGGLVIMDLSREDGVPVWMSELTSRSTKKANRVVLLDAIGRQSGQVRGDGLSNSLHLAVVPLEQANGRFALYNIIDPEAPCLVGISEPAAASQPIDETYCLEAWPISDDTFRVALMTAPGTSKGEKSTWWYYDIQHLEGNQFRSLP